MSMYGYDAAYPPDPKIIATAGGKIMTVYLTGPHAVSLDWVARIHAAGMGALANYERQPGELVTVGRTGGQRIGQTAMGAAVALGFPANGTVGIYFSVDVNVPQSQFAAVGAAFDGIGDVIAGKFVPHVYGEGALINYLVATHRVRHAQWLSASTSFPGYNRDSPNVGLAQLLGTDVPNTDKNLITNAAGLDVFWPVSGGSDLSAQEVDEIKQFIDDRCAAVEVKVHNDLAGTIQRIVDDTMAISNDTIALHAAQYLSGGRALPPGPGINLPGLQVNLQAAVDAAVVKMLAQPGGTRAPLKVTLEGTAE